jgi:hypothetical protein
MHAPRMGVVGLPWVGYSLRTCWIRPSSGTPRPRSTERDQIHGSDRLVGIEGREEVSRARYRTTRTAITQGRRSTRDPTKEASRMTKAIGQMSRRRRAALLWTMFSAMMLVALILVPSAQRCSPQPEQDGVGQRPDARPRQHDRQHPWQHDWKTVDFEHITDAAAVTSDDSFTPGRSRTPSVRRSRVTRTRRRTTSPTSPRSRRSRPAERMTVTRICTAPRSATRPTGTRARTSSSSRARAATVSVDSSPAHPATR